jgi:C-terminal processing protease CtpA/Prc
VCERERERERERKNEKKRGQKKVKTLTSCWSRRNFCSFLRMQAGVGMSVDKATPLSDGFCVVREIHRGGAVHIAGYEQKNGEILRVQVGDWLLRVNGISCKHMPRAEVKRSIVGPPGTKVELVFASKRDNKNITVQLFRMLKEKGTEVEFTPEINHEQSIGRDGERERDRGRGRSLRQEI